MDLKALGDSVVIKPIRDIEAGIPIWKKNQAEVIAVSPRLYLDIGVGDKVVYKDEDVIEIDGLSILHQKNILAVIK